MNLLFHLQLTDQILQEECGTLFISQFAIMDSRLNPSLIDVNLKNLRILVLKCHSQLQWIQFLVRYSTLHWKYGRVQPETSLYATSDRTPHTSLSLFLD